MRFPWPLLGSALREDKFFPGTGLPWVGLLYPLHRCAQPPATLRSEVAPGPACSPPVCAPAVPCSHLGENCVCGPGSLGVTLGPLLSWRACLLNIKNQGLVGQTPPVEGIEPHGLGLGRHPGRARSPRRRGPQTQTSQRWSVSACVLLCPPGSGAALGQTARCKQVDFSRAALGLA